jgi:hypothetical protein
LLFRWYLFSHPYIVLSIRQQNATRLAHRGCIAYPLDRAMKLSLHNAPRGLALLSVCGIPILIAVCCFFMLHITSSQHQRLNDLLTNISTSKTMLAQYSLSFWKVEKAKFDYVTTRSPHFLVGYNLAKMQMEITQPYMDALIGPSDSRLAAEIANLKMEMRNLFISCDRMIADGKFYKNDNEERTRRSERISALLKKVITHENQSSIERRANLERESHLREILSILLVILSASALSAVGYLILRIRLLHNIITICAWTQRVNYNGKWIRMETFLWERFGVKATHGISEEAFSGVMGVMDTHASGPTPNSHHDPDDKI